MSRSETVRLNTGLPGFESGWIGGEENWLDFLERYFEESPPERRAEVEEEGPFYEARLFLRRLDKQAERDLGRGDPARFTVGERAENWREVMRVTGIR